MGREEERKKIGGDGRGREEEKAWNEATDCFSSISLLNVYLLFFVCLLVV